MNRILSHDSDVVRQLRTRPAWIFDLDGTLTQAQHDFAAIRRELGIADQAPILEALDAMPPEESRRKRTRLDELEADIAREARVADGAHDLLGHLRAAGASLGVLTRNTKLNAHLALEATGLAEFFEAPAVLGRDDARPKPDPQGILALLGAWRHRPDEAVMLGDYVYDLEAGRNARTLTVHVDALDRFDFGDRADLRTLGLAPLHTLLGG